MKFRKNHIIAIASTMLVAVSLVMFLAWLAVEPINKKNGFARTMIPGRLTMLKSIDKPDDVVDFAGSTLNLSYFKTKKPERIWAIDNGLNKMEYITLNVPVNKIMASRFSQIVDSPNIYIMAGNVPAVIIAGKDKFPFINQDFRGLFTRSAMISSNTFVFRGFDSTMRSLDQIFFKIDLTQHLIRKENLISEKRKDAGISTDGILHYDSITNLIAYVSFYSNKVLYIDTNLNLIRRGQTIDTFTVTQATAEGLSTKNAITNLVPKRLINSTSCVSNGKLFNNSVLVSDNESNDIFSANSVIDVYNISNGSYENSFYIPNYKGNKMIKFKVVKDIVLVMYKNAIICYSLSNS